MKALIFAAGLGTRLKPITDSLPKALVPIAGHTLLEWQILRLKEAGITDMVINVHHFPDQIIRYIDKNQAFGCKIQISDERDCLLETGGGLRKAETLLGRDEEILALNVDILSNIRIQDLRDAYNQENPLGMLVVSERETQRYLLFDSDNRLRGWTNTSTNTYRPDSLLPEVAQAYRPLAFSGMQILSPDIFTKMDKVVSEKGDKFSLIDLYISLVENEVLRAYIPENYRMMDVGKIDQLSEAECFAQSLISNTEAQSF